MSFRCPTWLAFCLIGLFLGPLLLATSATAHEMRPALLELKEEDNDQWTMTWKVPARGPDMRLSLDVRLPEGFEWIDLPSREYIGEAFVDRGRFQLPGGLDNREIYIEGLLSTFTEAMVQIQRLDGTLQNVRLDPSAPSLIVEARPSPSEIPRFYFSEGWRYLRGAWDHFAFVLIIVLACTTNRSALASVACFLVAIAVTALASSAGTWSASNRWIEVMVALSLIPPSLAVLKKNGPALIHRIPAAFSAAAGVLHGASLFSLYSVTSPTERSFAALAAFLAAALLGLALFGSSTLFIKALLARPANSSSTHFYFAYSFAYAIGVVAVAWTLQRWSL